MRLENWHYLVKMQCGGDIWALYGQRFGREGIEEGSWGWVSTPKAFDEEKMTVTTYSGSVYELGECGGNLEQQKQYIRDDVELCKKEENAHN